jgi:hypothetical protein
MKKIKFTNKEDILFQDYVSCVRILFSILEHKYLNIINQKKKKKKSYEFVISAHSLN